MAPACAELYSMEILREKQKQIVYPFLVSLLRVSAFSLYRTEAILSYTRRLTQLKIQC